jgi:hypothetical protein
MSIVWILLATWFVLLGLFVALRVRATRRPRLALDNVRRLPFRSTATTQSASRRSNLPTAHQRAVTAPGSLAAASPRR